MEEIESLEQTLIQHLRTSGLRPNKEVSLVEEILEIRKKRRQLFTQLDIQSKEANVEAGKAIHAAQSERDEMKEALAQWKRQQTQDLQELQQAWDEREQAMLREEEKRMEKLRLEWSRKFDKLRGGYVDQLQGSEEKIKQLSREKDQLEERITNSLTKRVQEEMKEEYQKKFEEKVAE
jgi:uncharacterized coiled-coil DUF342 family protein